MKGGGRAMGGAGQGRIPLATASTDRECLSNCCPEKGASAGPQVVVLGGHAI